MLYNIHLYCSPCTDSLEMVLEFPRNRFLTRETWFIRFSFVSSPASQRIVRTTVSLLPTAQSTPLRVVLASIVPQYASPGPISTLGQGVVAVWSVNTAAGIIVVVVVVVAVPELALTSSPSLHLNSPVFAMSVNPTHHSKFTPLGCQRGRICDKYHATWM